MSVVEKHVEIDAPAERVWEVLADFGEVEKWSPTVTHSALVGELANGVGSERSCALTGIGDITERVIAWDGGKGFTIEIFGAPIVKSLRSAWSIEGRGDQTVVSVRAEFEPNVIPDAGAPDEAAIIAGINETVEQTLAGLRHHVQTGELVGTEVPAA